MISLRINGKVSRPNRESFVINDDYCDIDDHNIRDDNNIDEFYDDDLIEYSPKVVKNFIKEMIEDYGSTNYEGYSLFIQDVPSNVKKIFLSLLIDPEAYEFYCKNNIRLENSLKYFKKYMQKVIDEHRGDLFSDYRESKSNEYDEDYGY